MLHFTLFEYIVMLLIAFYLYLYLYLTFCGLTFESTTGCLRVLNTKFEVT